MFLPLIIPTYSKPSYFLCFISYAIMSCEIMYFVTSTKAQPMLSESKKRKDMDKCFNQNFVNLTTKETNEILYNFKFFLYIQ